MKASPSLKFSAIFFFLGHFFCLRSFMAKNKMWRNWNMECRKHFEWIFWAETWSITAAFEKKLYSLHQWHLRRLLRLSYLRHVTNMEVLRLTCQTQLSTTLRDKRLRLLFIATADSRTDHAGVLRSIILGLPIDLKRQVLPVFHEQLASYDWTGLAAAQHRLGVSLATGSGRGRWKRTVDTATLQDGVCSWWWWYKLNVPIVLVVHVDIFSMNKLVFGILLPVLNRLFQTLTLNYF